MSALARTILRTGLLKASQLAEFYRWGLLPDPGREATPAPTSLAELNQQLEQALEEEHLAIIRETDLDILQRYLDTQRVGRLHITAGEEKTAFDVTHGRTLLGEYVLPWRGENIEELLTNGHTYLEDKEKKVFFSSVREVFFGETKCFLVCTPSVEESDGPDPAGNSAS